MERVITNEMLAEAVDNGDYTEPIMSEQFDVLRVPGTKPSTARKLRTAIVAHLDTLPPNEAAAWQKPRPRLEDVVKQVNNLADQINKIPQPKPVDEKALAKQVTDQIKADREEIGLISHLALETLGEEIANRLETRRGEVTQVNTAVTQPDAPVVPPNPPTPVPETVTLADLNNFKTEIAKMLAEGVEVAGTEDKTDDRNFIQKALDWGNKPVRGKKEEKKD